ncbi:MAG: hypothetical protein GW938_05380 [Leptospira sp.]|nr:hypothetical protein [Leptospira sp.]NCS94265.1 hypothetical protein [Leptospira sp.]
MAYLPRHESHRKKKSKFPYLFLLFFLGLAIFGYFQERKIRLFFTKDQKQKIEKQKAKIQVAIEKNELIETYVRDFDTYSVDFLDKDPLDPSSIHYRARSYYYSLLLNGLQFDSASLIAHIDEPISQIFGDSNKTKDDFAKIFRYARMAESIKDDFPEYESNKFLLFLTEAYRERKNFPNIYKEYSLLDTKSLESEFHHPTVWLLVYSAVRSGNTKDLEKLLEANKADDFLGKILLTEREENFLNGMCYYYAKDFVPALNYLRKSKSDFPDFITEKSLLMEARIFYAQNLHQKAVDLLSVGLNNTKKKNQEYKKQLKAWIAERPNLKTNVDLTEAKAIDTDLLDED